MKRSVLGLILELVLTTTAAYAWQNDRSRLREQRSFSVEQDLLPVRKPVKLSEPALLALETDAAVLSCMKDQSPPDKQPEQAWFQASQIHLNSPNETDLIVSTAGSKSPCFMAPYAARFWVLQKRGEGYQLVLATDAHDLSVLGTKTNHYRDIETSVSNLHGTATTLSRFDGHRYKSVGTRIEPPS
jgi:hypothetical protein